MYRWSILPAKAHLFQKNLSKLSSGVYNQIIEGIGTYIEAIHPNRSILVADSSDDAFCNDDVSFSFDVES